MVQLETPDRNLVEGWAPEHPVFSFLDSWPANAFECKLLGGLTEDEAEVIFEVHTSKMSRVAFCFERDPEGHHSWLSMDLTDLRYVEGGPDATHGFDMADGFKMLRQHLNKYNKRSDLC